MENIEIRQNSYWMLDGDEDDEDAKMVALCSECAQKERKGWFWDGKRLGYGDYDLFCKNCGSTINLRKNNVENQTDNKNQQ